MVALAAAAWRLWRVRRISPSLATVLGIGVSFWGLVALAGGGRRVEAEEVAGREGPAPQVL